MSAESSASSSATSTVSSCSAKSTIRTRSSSAAPLISRSRVIPSFFPDRPWPGRILSSGLRSRVGFVSWITPRKFAPVEPWSMTGRAPPIRSTEHERTRVSSKYRPSPRESEWMSPHWSVSRNRLTCLRTWTLPRSVAFSIGVIRGSTKRTPSWLARSCAVGRAPAFVSVIVASRERGQPFRLVGHSQRFDELVDVARHDPRQRRQVEIDPMVGDPVLGEVVGPDLVRAVARADHRAPGRRIGLALLRELAVVKPGPKDGERLCLALVLALLVLDLDDEAGRQMGDPDGRVGRVHRLPARPGRALDVDPQVLVLIDVDLDLIGLRHDDDRRRRRV